MKSVKDYIISIPDFPSKGIIFRDVTSVLESSEGYALAIDELNKLLDGVDYDLIAGTESRGFIFGAPLAYMNKKGFIPVRKKGKLPRETVEMSYDLEYGSATIEIHKDAIKPGDKVVLVDDLIATGGTIQAAAKLVEELGGEVVKMIFLIELTDLGVLTHQICVLFLVYKQNTCSTARFMFNQIIYNLSTIRCLQHILIQRYNLRII